MHDECESTGIRVCRCSHGAYHIGLGAMTLHFSEDQLVALYRVLDSAIRSEPVLLGRILLEESQSSNSQP